MTAMFASLPWCQGVAVESAYEIAAVASAAG